MSKTLLVVHHSKSGGAAAMADAVIEGASGEEGVSVVSRRALEATPADVRRANAVILGTPENFGYMSGALKHFFDTVYYEVIDETEGLPYALFVKAGNDGTGAVTAVRRIVTGLRWREVQEPIIVTGEVTPAHLEACRELGAALAAGLDLGVF